MKVITARSTALLLALAITVGCDGSSSGETQELSEVGNSTQSAPSENKPYDGEPEAALERKDCVTVYAPPEAEAEPKSTTPVQRVVYLNRYGGTYTSGPNDSSNNVSSVPNGTVTLPPYQGSDADWQNLVSCVRSEYARFNVVITDQDPGAAQHIEAVIGGLPSALGFPSNVGGVSPFNCNVIGKSVSFIFSQVYSSVRGVCEATAHEIGHSFGLEHEYLCQDPMTYLYGCGAKTFQDTAASCGTDSAVSCTCGSPTQNTVQKLFANVGAATTQTTPQPTPQPVDAAPTVALTSPSQGASIARGAIMSVRATASDDKSVQQVVLTWQGPYGSSTYRLNALGGTSYGVDLRLSSTAPVGARTLSVAATDSAGQVTRTPAITIQVR